VTVQSPDLLGLRDRALIGLMAYSFAPRRRGVADESRRLFRAETPMGTTAEKGGKKGAPFHHDLDHFLDEYIAAAGISVDANGYRQRLSVLNDDAQVGHSNLPPDRHRCLSKEQRQAGSRVAHRLS
jgi:integrase/recombinase XerD